MHIHVHILDKFLLWVTINTLTNSKQYILDIVYSQEQGVRVRQSAGWMSTFEGCGVSMMCWGYGEVGSG